ncbi:MAG: hypothetical protein AB7L09_24715 [Nitrospira sp.]
MSTAITREELRKHYATIRNMISEERRLRETVLAFSPNLPAKLRQCDDALTSLAWLGNALATLLPPEEEDLVIQETLFDLPKQKGY